jgi:DNA replication protein DnaC
VTNAHNLIVTDPTGVGKSWLACALANSALRAGHTAYYTRAGRLLDDLAIGRADGRYARLLATLARVSVLVLDDFLLPATSRPAGTGLLEVIEDRASTVGRPRRAISVPPMLTHNNGTFARLTRWRSFSSPCCVPQVM